MIKIEQKTWFENLVFDEKGVLNLTKALLITLNLIKNKFEQFLKILPFMKKWLSYNFHIWKLYDNHFFFSKKK